MIYYDVVKADGKRVVGFFWGGKLVSTKRFTLAVLLYCITTRYIIIVVVGWWKGNFRFFASLIRGGCYFSYRPNWNGHTAQKGKVGWLKED